MEKIEKRKKKTVWGSIKSGAPELAVLKSESLEPEIARSPL